MCRNIKVLFNFDPLATDEEMRAAALQYVRKVSGFHKPSQINQAAFDEAIEEITASTRKLLDRLVTKSEPHNRDAEAAKARARAIERFGK